jgi:uncharacterized protein YcfJ
MRNALKIGLASALAITTAVPAYAQYYQPTQQYERDLRAYDDDRQDYAERRADYQQARRDYERRLSAYEMDRDRYDRRYGRGAYARAYGAAPVWDSAYWDGRAYDRDARDYGYNASATYGDPCRQRANGNAVAGGIIGALAGAALGSNVAARNARTEGAVLGAVVGGALGANIGKSSTKCDSTGAYFTYDETIPYRESRDYRGRRSGAYDYSYYNRQRCRLAAAPVEYGDRMEARYVRVCPDGSGRYRITG